MIVLGMLMHPPQELALGVHKSHGDAGSLGVVDLGKDDASPVACVACWLLWRVGVQGSWLHNMLSMNSTEMKF
jgi:hypothetical protein